MVVPLSAVSGALGATIANNTEASEVRSLSQVTMSSAQSGWLLTLSLHEQETSTLIQFQNLNPSQIPIRFN